ncbi:phage terminase small subunit P27 family [Blastopirellula marina]|uniref:Phage terminase small subunit P27 family n=1 Tax=Blastopirellula marina TaxID=124 RepID=A0A2S8F7F1_9BACT|nr:MULTISPECIES: phage terminase small subunit P27 family [Pirellulaceae]PQO28089.1 phage terminase small subunit P27 family [Blastopirellula marina]RCS48515.1 phage terminase small subunit P27 family [Bremerella cremea]
MAKGRIPKPKQINDLKGDTHKRRRHTVEPKAPSDLPQCPSYLGDIAQKEWVHVTTQLKQMGLLSTADTTAIAMYCASFERWQQACETRKKCGDFIKTPNGHMQPGPWMSQIRQAEDSCRRWLIEFGLTPAARSRMAIPKEAAKSSVLSFAKKKSA